MSFRVVSCKDPSSIFLVRPRPDPKPLLVNMYSHHQFHDWRFRDHPSTVTRTGTEDALVKSPWKLAACFRLTMVATKERFAVTLLSPFY